MVEQQKRAEEKQRGTKDVRRAEAGIWCELKTVMMYALQAQEKFKCLFVCVHAHPCVYVCISVSVSVFGVQG